MTESVEDYLVLAEVGDSDAQYNLAMLYFNGEAVFQSYSDAVFWFKKAAKQNNVDAKYHLAGMYMTGRYVELDYTKAAQWYRDAAEQGHAPSQNNLGELYFTGDGVNQNKFEAERWFEKAQEQGNVNAETALETLAEDIEMLNINSVEQLANAIDLMLDNKKHVFREIIMINPRISGDIYSAFFNINNRIGGSNEYEFARRISYRSGLEEDEVLEQCYVLKKHGLIKEKMLTDWVFYIEETIVSLINKKPKLILSKLYTAEEQENYIPEFQGSFDFDEETGPYGFYDIDQKPLNGRFRIAHCLGMEPGIYEFKDGKLK